MVNVIYTEHFKEDFKKVDKSVKDKVIKQIEKIIASPETGKPLRYNLKGERTVYVKPFRIIYSYFMDSICLLRLEHRKDVYE